VVLGFGMGKLDELTCASHGLLSRDLEGKRFLLETVKCMFSGLDFETYTGLGSAVQGQGTPLSQLLKSPGDLFGKWRIQVNGRGLKKILGNFEL
jgi:hypothetical protein